MDQDQGIKVKRDGPRGYHIIASDKFDPKVHERYVEPGTDAQAGAGGDDAHDTDNMKVAELKEALDEKGIEYPSNAKKADLQALLDAAQ